MLTRTIMVLSVLFNIAAFTVFSHGGRVVPFDLALTFSRVSYINSCITAMKTIDPDKPWSATCRTRAEEFFNSIDFIINWQSPRPKDELTSR